MGEDDFMPDLDDFGDLDEAPPFDLAEEDLSIPGIDEEEEGGISRNFKIAGALILIAVIVVVILLIVFALGGDDLTDNQKTSTAVAQANATTTVEYGQTLEALDNIATATAAALATFNAQSTATQIAFETQQADQATAAAEQATADFIASQTAAANASATQQALDATATQTYLDDLAAKRIQGRVVDEEGTVFNDTTILLYRDTDNDGEFDAAVEAPAPGEAVSPPGAEDLGEPTGAQTINYGDTVTGTLAVGEPAVWTFTGATGDSVLIAAAASDPIQMDMFLELFGPDGDLLVGDDDSGGESDAAITGFVLPVDGEYTIRVSSVAAPGEYTLSLGLGLTIPDEPEPPTEAEPTQEALPGEDAGEDAGEGMDEGMMDESEEEGEGVSFQPGIEGESHVLARPAVQATPTPETGDEFIGEAVTDDQGEFDFGELDLEPGVYFLVLDYDSLPDDLKPLAPADEVVYVKVTVPTGGEPITFEITGVGGPVEVPTNTPEASFTPPFTPGTPMFATLTPTMEPTMPKTGIFDDINDGGSDIDGSSGLAVLAIAAAGLVAVVFIARKLRTS